MTEVQEKALFKLEIDENRLSERFEETDEELAFNEIEFDLVSPINLNDPRQVEIYNGIAELDERLAVIDAKVGELNSEIDRLTNHADGLDYTIAVASGVLTGLIDSFFVGEFSLQRGREWSSDKIDKFVETIAKKQGYTGNSPGGAIKYLEDRHPAASDRAMSALGGSRQHHLRDFAHHPTMVGLFFSMLTQFTEMAYGTDEHGAFKVVAIEFDEMHPKELYIGDTVPKKFMFGCVHWFFHLVSDMAGSNTTPGAGTGIPGPLLSLAKELSALPFFKNAGGKNELSEMISKLFNGTLLGKRNAEGKLEPLPFDLRTEMGLMHELGRQALPVIMNECIVRGFYFVRRFAKELREKDIRSISDLREIDWKKTLPFKNRTIVRMMTIATGTFTAVDLADAAIRSGGFNPSMILRVNFVGVGRFAIAICTDIGMGIKKGKLERERIKLTNEQLQLMNAKLFYKEADMWIAAEGTQKALDEVYIIMDRTAIEFLDAWTEAKEGSKNRQRYAENIRNNDKEFADELLDLLEWGI